MYLQVNYSGIKVIRYLCYMAKDFSIRNLQEEDYETMVKWWKANRFPVVTRIMLPDNLNNGGLMVYYKDKPFCSGILYSTSSSYLFHAEWIVASTEIKDREVRKEGLKFLINGLIYVAEKKGAKIIYTSLIRDSLIDRFKDCGFQEGSKGSTEMVRIL